MSAGVETACAVTAYARDVAECRVVAGRLVRLACARHLRDLEVGGDRGLRFDEVVAADAIGLIEAMSLPDGKGPFRLHGWEKFIVGCLFGWKTADDKLRRFRTAYIESGKGSGKSPLAAAVGLLGLCFDDEEAAEVYSAATTREQATISFRDAKNIADQSPALCKRLKVDQANIADYATRSFFRPVSSEHRGLDGKRVHVALIDEIHEHPTPLVVDKMRAGTKSRRQALIFEITNSGHDRTTVCWQHHEYSEKVLTGVLEDDSWFAYVCTLDPCRKCADAGQTQPTDGCPDCDDWRDEKVWPKANPSLPALPGMKYLREQVREAEGMPTKANIVKRLNFCLWTQVAEKCIPMDRWDACKRSIDWKALRGQPCFGALDIGATSDFTAFVLLFPGEDLEYIDVPVDPADPDGPRKTIARRSYRLRSFFWLPEHPVKRDPRMAAQLDAWSQAGLIRRTPGEVVDYDAVFTDIVMLASDYALQKIELDYGFQGVHIARRLMDHFGEAMVEIFRQGIVSMAGPFRELLELVVQGRLHHDGDPVLRWMASNVAAERKGGLVKPSKEKSAEKIDGITAATMGLAPALAANSGAPGIHIL